MELKEYFQIIKKHRRLFLKVIFAVLLGFFAYYNFKPVSYSNSLMINISRIGSQQTQDYQYDDFYRLQADEKFCETVVEWLSNPGTVKDIYQEAGINASDLSLKKLSTSVKAEKRSSQSISVSFSTPNEKISKGVADAIVKVISKKTEALNIDQKESTWFKVISDEPVIRKNKISFTIFLAVFLIGIFFAFWTVMIKHYLE